MSKVCDGCGAVTEVLCRKCVGDLRAGIATISAMLTAERTALATSQAAHLAEIEAHRVTKKALLSTAHAHDGTEWCWCAYTQIMHPPDDPQDGIELEENYHAKECNAARRVLAAEGTDRNAPGTASAMPPGAHHANEAAEGREG